MENNKTILEKVSFLLSKAKNKDCTNSDLQTIISYTTLHSDNAILGRVFGYSVSDYAFATLKWMGTEGTNKAFNELFPSLEPERKREIYNLIESNIYIQY